MNTNVLLIVSLLSFSVQNIFASDVQAVVVDEPVRRIGTLQVREVYVTNSGGRPVVFEIPVDDETKRAVQIYKNDHYKYWWPANLAVGAWTAGSCVAAMRTPDQNPNKVNFIKSFYAGLVSWIGMNTAWYASDRLNDVKSSVSVPAQITETVSSSPIYAATIANVIELTCGKGAWADSWKSIRNSTSTTTSGTQNMYVVVSVSDQENVALGDPKFSGAFRSGHYYRAEWNRSQFVPASGGELDRA